MKGFRPCFFRSVKDLARLSLKDPMYVSVHEHAEHSTPARLEQVKVVFAVSIVTDRPSVDYP